MAPPRRFTPTNKSEEGMNQRYATWTRQRRLKEAAERVVHEDWSQVKAAQEYGVSRQRLNGHVKELRSSVDAAKDRATEALAQNRAEDTGIYIGKERRRVPSFEDFDRMYWGNWICPDCGVHHETPDFHREMTEALLNSDPRTLMNIPPYHAKGLTLRTQIPTPSGWTTVGDLRVGDELFDKDGKVCRVKALSPPQEATYRVQVGGDNGPEFYTTDDHRWWVKPRDTKYARFTTTEEVAASRETRRFRVPVAGVLDLPMADLPIDPYVLGAWLGDGCRSSNVIASHEDDQPHMRGEFEAAGYRTTVLSHIQTFGVLRFMAGLKAAGLWKNKHIPKQYLRASAEQRLALLQGLMDTDGTVNQKARNCSFTNKNENLADGVFELAASLGWKARRCKIEAKLNGVSYGTAHVVSFCPTRDRSPFRMPRKTERLPVSRERVGYWPMTSVEKLVTPEPARCIAVDSPTETFLAGEAMVPTGNSTLATVKHSVYRLVTNPNSRTIIVSKSASFAATFLHSIAQLLTNPELYEGSERNLIHDFGPFQEPGGVWNAKNIYIAGRVTAEKDPTILTLGVEEQIYGRRADYIVFDDCATLENQRNPERVQKMLEWMDKEALSRIGKRGKAVWVGTRVHAGDIYSRLMHREGYRVIRYSCIQDDAEERTLWPEHFPYSQAQVHRAEMNPADFQLVYQNVDLPGVGASFPPEVVEACKDDTRVIGQTAPGWRFVGGLDPAGGGKKSGFTSITVLAVDLRTGQRYLVDQQNHRSFKAPQTKDLILKWSEAYPISEWRVEVNGLQGQIYQYDEELVRALALRGIRLQPHITHGKNKWDPQFGVESMAPLFHAGLFSIPWGNRQSQEGFRALCEQLISFPMGEVSDAVMSLWFAELGCRDLLRRQHMPLFNERQKVPKHVARRRHVVDFGNREVRNLELEQQRPGAMMSGLGPSRYRRQTVGVPTPNSEVDDSPPAFPEPARFVNVAGQVDQ